MLTDDHTSTEENGGAPEPAASATRITEDRGVRIVRLRRDGKVNAMTNDDIAVVRSAFCDSLDGVRAIIVCGHAGNFSSGMLTSTFDEPTLAEKLQNGFVRKPGHRMLDEIRTCPLPTIAAVEGACVGLAMDIAAVCDLRIVARNARFAMPELKLGLPVVTDASLFPEHFGLAKAKEIILSGRLYGAEELAPYGFINELCDSGAVEECAMRWAQELAGLPQRAYAAQKRIFEAWLELPHREASARSLLEFAITVSHPGDETEPPDPG